MWNREVFGKLELDIEKLFLNINEYGRIAGKGESLGDVAKLKGSSDLFWKKLYFKENLLKQKSRSKWMKGMLTQRFCMPA